jgi:hypothetical protein
MPQTPRNVLLRLDIERVRLNLERTAGEPQTLEDAVRFIARMGVRLREGGWFEATPATAAAFTADEVLERRDAPGA